MHEFWGMKLVVSTFHAPMLTKTKTSDKNLNLNFCNYLTTLVDTITRSMK